MTDVQFEILRTLYEAKSDFGESVTTPIDGVLSRVNLGLSALDLSDEDIYSQYDRLKNALFIVEQNTYLSITLLGKEMYLREKRDRELLRTKLEREVSLLESNKKVNGYQYWIKWSMIITTFFTGVNAYLTYRQQELTKIQSSISLPKLEQKYLVDSPQLFQNGHDHHIISQTKP